MSELIARFTQADLLRQLNWDQIDPDYLRQIIGLAKIEDLAGAGLVKRPKRLGDVTTTFMPEGPAKKARLVVRESMTVCGIGIVQHVLNAYGDGCEFKSNITDGTEATKGDVLGTLSGPANLILQAERTLLNFLQHLSGIATETRVYVTALDGSKTALLDTRKTLPGYRILQKYAFARGGGYNHRMGLFDRVMFKDNHLAVAGAIDDKRLSDIIALARATCGELPVEVEVDHLDQIPPVLKAGADIILLDNFSLEDIKEAVSLIGPQACTEASGGITHNALRCLGELGLDFISTGAPIHQSRWKDIGLDWS